MHFEAFLLMGMGNKASRGTGFGIGGYVYLHRGRSTCGIADYAIVPL